MAIQVAQGGTIKALGARLEGDPMLPPDAVCTLSRISAI